MCLIVHKPAGVQLPPSLIESALRFNPHGAGLIALPKTEAARVERRQSVSSAVVARWAQDHAAHECVFHFRYRTRGTDASRYTHPIRVTGSLYLFHNGTLPGSDSTDPHSDTWHLARDLLRPVLRANPELLVAPMFRRLLEGAIGPSNRLVLVDTARRRVEIINRAAGVSRDGLWLSNVRWFDARALGWSNPAAAAPAVRLSFVA